MESAMATNTINAHSSVWPKVAVRAFFAVCCAQILWLNQSFAVDNFNGDAESIANETPHEIDGVGVDAKLGGQIDLDLKFTNEQGELVPLSTYTKDGQAMLLSLAYFSCPSLCNFHLNGLNDAFKKMPATLGKEFQVVVVSIDPKETPALASKKRDAYIEAYGRPEGVKGWHFLVGTAANVKKLTEEAGFKYKWDPKSNQWAHASAALILTPAGRISRYFYGITFNPKDLRLSLIEASNGNIGTIVDRLVLFCFHFDPKASKYTIAAFNVMRAGGGLAVVILAAFLVPVWIRSRKEDHVQGDS